MFIVESQIFLILRCNIALESDLLLARMELESFLPDKLRDVVDIRVAFADLPAQFSPPVYVRPAGQQAYSTTAPLSVLPELVRRASFIQRIYCLTSDTPQTHHWLHEIENKLGPVFAYHAEEKHLVIEAVPHYALFELSDVISRRSKNAADTKHNLQLLLNALLGRTDNPRAHKLLASALSAKSSTSHLSHDVHYYKAKFFPRLARSMLNVCAHRLENQSTAKEAGSNLLQRAVSRIDAILSGDTPQATENGESLRVLDNLAGSGTTLLESSLLGMPSVGLDIDPLSVLISRAKLDVLNMDSTLVEREVFLAVDRLKALSSGQLHLFDSPPQHSTTPITFPPWLMKNRRMTPEIAVDLSTEISALQTVAASCDPYVRDLFRVLMSDAIARRIRMRFLGTGVGRFSLTFSKTSLADIFTKSLRKYAKVISTCEWLRDTLHLQPAAAQVHVADTRAIPKNLGFFDIILTSPPYLPSSSGRESYAKARAPSLIALEMVDNVDALVDDSIASMDSSEIDLSALSDSERDVVEWLQGDKLRSIKAAPTARYFLDMRRAFSEMYRVLRPGGLAVVVSGKQSTFYRFGTREVLYTVHTARILAGEAARAGFTIEGELDLLLKKGNLNARPRSLDEYYETLIMLRK